MILTRRAVQGERIPSLAAAVRAPHTSVRVAPLPVRARHPYLTNGRRAARARQRAGPARRFAMSEKEGGGGPGFLVGFLLGFLAGVLIALGVGVSFVMVGGRQQQA